MLALVIKPNLSSSILHTLLFLYVNPYHFLEVNKINLFLILKQRCSRTSDKRHVYIDYKIEKRCSGLMIKDTWKQIAKLTRQLVKVRRLKDHEKSNHGSMTNFENPF
jgi:hypothetical protein